MDCPDDETQICLEPLAEMAENKKTAAVNKKTAAGSRNTAAVPETKMTFYKWASLTTWLLTLNGANAGFLKAYPNELFSSNLYEQKSSATPPALLVYLMSFVICILQSLFGWFISLKLRGELRYIFALFLIQLGLFWSLQPTFDEHGDIQASVGIMSSIILSVSAIVIRLAFLDIQIMNVRVKFIGCILLPYLVWMCFEAYLTIYILANNEIGPLDQNDNHDDLTTPAMN